jgi:glycosyltransferase involved in cell wall biosynthesis
MKISIVTISYNQAQYLEQAILSVINQEYPDKEYIVVDPGSTDGSREIIEKYRDRIDKIIFEPDEGPADGLNKGFACATGDVYGFINADDALMAGSLAYVAHFFIKCEADDVLLGAGYVIDQKGERLWRVLPTPFSIRRYVTGGFEFLQQGMFFRRRAFKAAGGFNVNNRTCWDAELLLDMALSGKIINRRTANLALFRLHGESISGTGRLNIAYRAEQERLFAKAMQRQPCTMDKFYGFFCRGHKVASDPIFYSIRWLKKLARFKKLQVYNGGINT